MPIPVALFEYIFLYWKYYIYHHFKELIFLIDKSYLDNVEPRNILHGYEPRNLCNDNFNFYSNNSLDNMIINSNLENENLIK